MDFDFFNIDPERMEEGLKLRTLEELSQHMQMPMSLLRLLVDLKLPLDDQGRTCAIMALGWLRDHCAEFRQLSALGPLAVPTGLAGKSRWMWWVCATDATVAEYSASRASDPTTKRFWKEKGAESRAEMQRIEEQAEN